MNTHIQIRNVPNALHRKLKMRAAQRDMSLSDYLRQLLQAEAARPTLAELTERLKNLPPVRTSDSAADIIRRERDAR